MIVVKNCPVCGKPYVLYSHYCGDQSKCRECLAAEKKAVERPSTPEEIERRRRAFGEPK